MAVQINYKTFTLDVFLDKEDNWKGKIIELKELDNSNNKYTFTANTYNELKEKFEYLVDEYINTPRIETQFLVVYKNSTLYVQPLVDRRYSAVCGSWIFGLFPSLDELIAAFQERVEEYIHSGCISINRK